jgi:hypothetical protein
MMDTNTIVVLAKQYYPTLWNMDRIIKLFTAGKISAHDFYEITHDKTVLKSFVPKYMTAAQYTEITGESYT